MNSAKENLTQSLCDRFLRCPICFGLKTLKFKDSQDLFCSGCHNSFPIRFGIPALMDINEIESHSARFLNKRLLQKDSINPYKIKQRGVFHLFAAEILYFFIAVSFLFKYDILKLLRRRWDAEVNRAFYYGWKNYFSLILKSGEAVYFNKMRKYINEPSMEIGCGECKTTNLIFRDRLDSVSFGCEYFMDMYLKDPLEDDLCGDLSPEMFKVINHYVGGSITSLPFAPRALKSVYMVHIIDHIADTDIWFRGINRVLEPAGYLIISGYSKFVFENLPGVKFRKVFSKRWAEKYKLKRVTKENPYHGGIPLGAKNCFYNTGMNILSLSEWKVLAKRHGFELVDNVFFGKYFSLFMDLEYRGFLPSYFFSELIYSAISRMTEEEKGEPLSEEESTNVVLVFKKINEVNSQHLTKDETNSSKQ